MNLYDLISEAQDGRAVSNLGRQFGLSEDEAATAVKQLLPAFSTGLKRNTASEDGLGSLLGALRSGRHERYYDDDGIFGRQDVRDDGEGILENILGSEAVGKAAAERASEKSGIDSGLLQKMLPYIAAIIMGALFKKGQNPLGDILGGVLGGDTSRRGAAPDDNPFGDLAEVILGGGKQASGRKPVSGTDIFGEMLDADGDGSSMDDIFDMVFGGKR